jgi:type IV pilus assembly protein PilM
MPSRRVGVEISHSAVRIAEVATGGARPELVAFGQVSLPPRAVVDGAVKDHVAVRVALARCLKEGGFSTNRVYLGLAGLRAITREIDMPDLPDSELDSAIRLQALDVIPFPIDKTLLSARPLRAVGDENGTRQRRVLLAGAHRDLVDPLVQVCKDAGLTPLSIDLTSSALVRSLGRISGEGGPQAIISIGAGVTTLVIHEHGVPHFVRTIATGGDAITGTIAATLDMPVADAEALKRDLDRPDQTNPNAQAAAGAAAHAVGLLLSEIRSSIEYYATLPGKSPVQQVIATGGAARQAGLMEMMAAELDVPVVQGACLAGLDRSRLSLSADEIAKIEPVAAVAIGLALPEPASDAKSFNLIPPELVARERERRMDRTFVTVGIALVVLMLGGGVWRFLQVHSAQDNLAALQNSITTLSKQKVTFDRAAKLHQQVLTDQALVLPLISDEENWPAVLTALQHHTPPGLQILSFAGSTSLPSDYEPPTGPVEIQEVADPAHLPTDSQLLGVVNLQVKGTNYLSFEKWIDAYENKQSGAPTDGPFVIESLSGIAAASQTGVITFTSSLGVTGAIHSARFEEFEAPAG